MSNPDGTGRPSTSRDGIFDVVADGTRRTVLRIVHERSPDGVEKSELATELAAVTGDDPADEVTGDDRRRARLDCHHRTVPALIDAGLVAETDDGRVVTTDHRAFDDPVIGAVLEGDPDDHVTDLDELLGALADARRRTVLTALAARNRPLETATLARDVAARETGTASRPARERIDRVRVSLVHRHLPLLDDVGFLAYDRDTDSVTPDWCSNSSAGLPATVFGRGVDAVAADQCVRAMVRQ